MSEALRLCFTQGKFTVNPKQYFQFVIAPISGMVVIQSKKLSSQKLKMAIGAVWDGYSPYQVVYLG